MAAIEIDSQSTAGTDSLTPVQPAKYSAMQKPTLRQQTPRKNAPNMARSAGSRSVRRTSTAYDDPREPNVTAQEWPISAVTTATIGLNPSPTSSGALTATGTPNPHPPWMKDGNAQPSTSSCSSLLPCVSRVKVETLILQRLTVTLFILGSAYVVAIVVALPVGILSAVKPYSLFDQMATTFAFIGYSLPTFFTGLLFILLFSIHLDWLPFIYNAHIDSTGWAWYVEHLRQAAMPIAVLGLFQAAALTRFVRASMLEVINQDYVTTARAKGVSEWRTMLKHALRNALIPVVTVIALQIPTIFTGAVITEQIFRIPGIGSLLITSIESTDTPVVMAITFVYSALVIIFNLVADAVYGFLDPRIVYG